MFKVELFTRTLTEDNLMPLIIIVQSEWLALANLPKMPVSVLASETS